MKTFSKQPAETDYCRIDCPLCGSVQYKTLWKNGMLPFVRCKRCRLVYQNPQPDNAQLFNRYDDEYFKYEIENEDSFFNLMKLGLDDIHFFEYEKIMRKREGRQNLSFLDVGCATGKLIKFIRSRGWSVKGVEICENSAAYGRENYDLDIHTGTLETACLPEDSIDVLHCSHLVEHLTAPGRFFAEASRVLKPGGYMVAVTPDISGFQARLFGEAWRSAIADHMILFSKKTLKKMFRMYGFKIVETATWGGLAAGTAPPAVKKFADRVVKKIGVGDVVCIMAQLTE